MTFGRGFGPGHFRPAVRRTAAEVGAPAPRIRPVDELLDEWKTQFPPPFDGRSD
jgi:hypothetical protein